MRPAAKIALGYVAAFVGATAAVGIKMMTEGPEADAESGMRAFGDIVLFLSVFIACALIPTGFALFYLLRTKLGWGLVLAAAAIMLAGAAYLYAVLVDANRAGTFCADTKAGMGFEEVVALAKNRASKSSFDADTGRLRVTFADTRVCHCDVTLKDGKVSAVKASCER